MNENIERRCPNPRPSPKPRPKIVPLGTVVRPWGKIVAVGVTMGERYYWFVEDNCVSMMPAFIVEEQMAENKNGERSAAVSTSGCELGNVSSNLTAHPIKSMKWYRFDRAKGYRQKRPPIGKWVLVLLPPKDKPFPCGIALGYRKNAAGCADSPYFVIPGIGGLPIAWCDCLPDSFDYPMEIDSSARKKMLE